ncbi:hypothetical protein NA57DRAFT_55491 [Rhizodiscina lignyota]|uniref:Zn(2)-C6 fungal-type domain-containing protein n=1 Tax=Rhizodiscina lignyota TaxID=1504668 RepID=A0A9P4IGE4_9PEZI|nr:hypothetical protein NA57DRAFT_55491 [Rhizodiscina lignyota]
MPELQTEESQVIEKTHVNDIVSQCDEAKPACRNCVKHSIRCSFAANSPSSDLSPSNPPEPRVIPSRFELDGDSAASSPGLSPCNAPLLPFPVADLELLHHYMTSSSSFFADNRQNAQFWQVKVPQLGFEHHFILRLLLAISALHIARDSPERQESSKARAEEHYVAALRAITALLPHVNETNCHALFLASTLVCHYSFGKGPTPGDYLAFSNVGQPEWLRLFKGVRAIIESNPDVVKASGVLPSVAQGEMQKHEPNLPKRSNHFDFRTQFERIRRVIAAQSPSPESEIYMEALDSLENCFAATYEGKSDAWDERSRSSHIMFRWLYQASEPFVARMQDKRPMAIVIFSFFAVLMKEHADVWTLDGWAEHIMTGIHAYLPPVYHDFIQWPMQQVNWTPPKDDTKME